MHQEGKNVFICCSNIPANSHFDIAYVMMHRMQVKDVLQRHLSAIMPFQSEDGRWRQLVNDTTSFLETSCTAMFTSAIARSIIHGWIDPQYHDAYIKAAQKVSCHDIILIFIFVTMSVDIVKGTCVAICLDVVCVFVIQVNPKHWV